MQLLEEAVQQARLQIQGNLPEAVANGPTGSHTGPAEMPRASVPGLQDLRGSWAGSLQAYGGGGGASNVDFDIKGIDWQWGYYKMDEVCICMHLNIDHISDAFAMYTMTSRRRMRSQMGHAHVDVPA